jgi:YHS domain-containing protein
MAMLPSKNDETDDLQQITNKSYRTLGTILTVGLCLGSVAAYTSMNKQIPSETELDVFTTRYSTDSSCLLASNGPVLGGYDMVAYFSLDADADGVLGSSDYSSTYGSDEDNLYTFYFSTAENKALFDASPTDYLPKYGGFCAWGISEETWWTSTTLGPAANPNEWVIIDSSLYFFMKDEPKEKFLGEWTDINDDVAAKSGDTSKYISDGDKRWSDWFGSTVELNTNCFYGGDTERK